MLAVKVKLKQAQAIKRQLIDLAILNFKNLPLKEKNYIYFPVTKQVKVPNFPNLKFVQKTLPKKQKPQTITDLLSKFLTKKQINSLPKSQEIVGDIIILEIPDQLAKLEKKIANTFLKANKNVKTVVKKTHIHSGQFRLRGVEVLAGINKKDTIHLESKVRLYLNLEQTYFSARLANERLRIANLIKTGESVLVMFSGSAPYPLVLAKNSKAAHITAVEMNPKAHKFAKKNLTLNKIKDDKITLYNGDVKDILPTLKTKNNRLKLFNRIVMPLPKTGEEFLYLALPRLKKQGIIHLYAFLNEADIKSEEKRILNICKKLSYKTKLLRTVKCGQHAPYTFRVCFDLQLL